jgi:2-polyprenyl-6-methoxyphenol hydroxylase-like FAD-dependent oxidoreductase
LDPIMLSLTTDVLIIGAGPTGMALALTLAQAGVDHLVVERSATPQTTSRAAVIHAHTLEILAKLGVAERMASEGLLINRFALRDRDRELGAVTFDDLPSPHRHLLMLPQERTEAILLDRLAEHGTEILRGAVLRDLREAANSVEAVIEQEGRIRTVTARYVVGADGMHSRVRETCGIGFDGEPYEGSFVLADVTMMGDAEGAEEVRLYFSPEGLVVVAPLPGGRFRIVATAEVAPEVPDRAFIQEILDTRGPSVARMRVRDVCWSSRFRVHHRLAERYRKGPVFLVGDAAHVHSPAGGQGMNTGLVDAWTLGRLLVAVLKDGQPPATLDRYETLRRPAAAQVLRLAGRLTDIATVRGRRWRALRNLGLSIITRLPGVQRRLALDLSGLARRNATILD